MNIEELREFCLSLPASEETFPFDQVTLVFKVGGKMFAMTGLDATDLSINLKCHPDVAVELRERYPAVQPGYHMSKKHWNTVYIDGSIPRKQIEQWIIDSYWLVVNSLPAKIREQLK
jgi:predicted DNA-binding protein (MmcQ/YjbR family)